MRRLLLLPLVFVLASCAGRPSVPPSQSMAVEPETAAAGKVTSIEGKWREIKNENRPVMADKIWAFEDGAITISDGNRTYSGTFVYREDREPKEIDIVFEGYPLNKAIYAIDGNVMNIKLVDSNPERASKLGIEPGYTSIMCERIRD